VPRVIDETKVFEAAVALFVERGFDKTTTKEIAEAADVNEATLFRRYGSKTRLVEMAIDHEWRDVPLAEVAHTGDLEADLVSIVEAYLATSRLKGAIVPALLVELARGRDLHGAFGRAASNVRALAEIVAHHQADARLLPEDPTASLIALIGPLMVSEMFRRSGLGEPPAPIDPRKHVAAFLHGRSTDGEPGSG
jgi:AcrR family transcriptional regulator